MKIKNEIELIEYTPVTLSQDSISPIMGETLWKNYHSQISLDFPSPKTNWSWLLTNLGWVGYIPVSKEMTIVLKPKVPLENIFSMLEYAYNLKSIHFYEEQIECHSMTDFFNLLAAILAKRIMNRSRKGFYRAYKDENERLPFICGRVDLNDHLKAPWNVQFSCHYQDCTANIGDNQILLWTLYIIIRSGLCTDKTLKNVYKAFRSAQKAAELLPFTSLQCYKRSYNRLNLDYQPMHILCWFFLEHCGPHLITGKQLMLPFVVNMARLYELFVARWLEAHLPEGLELKIQERVNIGEASMLHFNIDLVIYEKATGKVQYVLDTKYKVSESISAADFSQVATYALAKNCKEAVLIYPGEMGNEFSGLIQDIRVRSLTFKIDDDIEQAGRDFLDEMLGEKIGSIGS